MIFHVFSQVQQVVICSTVVQISVAVLQLQFQTEPGLVVFVVWGKTMMFAQFSDSCR